jgi:ABC-type phosphate transport system auxiliary subunit
VNRDLGAPRGVVVVGGEVEVRRESYGLEPALLRERAEDSAAKRTGKVQRRYREGTGKVQGRYRELAEDLALLQKESARRPMYNSPRS